MPAMRLSGSLFFTFIIILTGCKTPSTESLIEQKLNTGWEFKNVHELIWHPAIVPGNLISEISKGRTLNEVWLQNSRQIKEMSESTWEYHTFFDVSPEIFSKDSISVDFPGLMPNTSIYLNNALIADTHLLEIPLNISCKKYLKIKNNCLQLVFHSPDLKNDNAYNFPYDLSPDIFNNTKVDSCYYVLNKLQQTKPDNINIPGVPETPYITAWSKAKIESVHFYPLTINDKQAQYNAEIEIMAAVESELNLEIIIEHKPVIKLYELKVKPGINRQIISFNINNPKFWWLNGLGSQHLYDISFRLMSGKQLTHEMSFPLGVRKLEINLNPDSSGNQLNVNFNGKPVFLKGCIVEMPDYILPELIDATYKQIVEDAKLAKVNIVRLLHANFYKPGLFYQLCNENGIMVWQDFQIPFSTRKTQRFDNFYEKKIRSSVINLRNLSCSAIYTGIITDAIDKKSLNNGTRDNTAGCDLMLKKISGLIKKYDSHTFYWNTGCNPKSNKQIVPENSDISINSIISSTGLGYITDVSLESLCSQLTLKASCSSSGISTARIDAFMNSPQHLKALTILNSDISAHISQLIKSYKNPANIDELIYLSGLSQADKIKQLIENNRISNPACTGLINIPLNNRMGSLLGAITENSGFSKPGYYALSRAYSDNALVVQKEGDLIKIYGINDELKDVDAILLCKMIDFFGKVYYVKQVPVKIQANSNALVLSMPYSFLLKDLLARQVCLTVQLNQPGRTAASNYYYFTEPRFLELPKASIKFDINETGHGFNIIIRSNVLAKNVVFETNKPGTRFSDNNLDILPGRRYKIHVFYEGPRSELLQNFKIYSLNNYNLYQQ
jgi:beta-mannosidase